MESRNKNTGYTETAASVFSLSDFPWREVKLQAAPSFPAKRTPPGCVETARGAASGKAGGFGYSESSLTSSLCRNRFILW